MKPPKKPIKQDRWYTDQYTSYEEYDGGWSLPPYQKIIFHYEVLVSYERDLELVKQGDKKIISEYAEAVDATIYHYGKKYTPQEETIEYLEWQIELKKDEFMYDLRDLREEIYGYHGSVPE